MAATVGGYQCEFVEQVTEELVCRACRLVAREPHIVNCCSQHYCQTCIEPFLYENQPCPNCNETDFDSLLLKGAKKRILALKVFCTMKEKGCKWTSALSDLAAHLDVENGDCQYTEIECPSGCARKILKVNLETHIIADCIKRDYMCPHCNFTATFEIVSEEHWPECLEYPLRCPNQCGVTCEREIMEDHMLFCPLEKVECELNFAGCKEKFKRNDQDEHMKQNADKHMSLLATATLTVNRENQEKVEQKLLSASEEVQRKLRDQEDSAQKQLEEKCVELSGKLDQLSEKMQLLEEKTEASLEQKSKEIEAKFQAKLEETVEKLQKGHEKDIEKLETQLATKDREVKELTDNLGKLKDEVSANKGKLEQEAATRLDQENKMETLTNELDKLKKIFGENDVKFQEVLQKEHKELQTIQEDHHTTLTQKTEKLELVKADIEQLKVLKDDIEAIDKRLEHPLVFTMYNFSREKQYRDWKSPQMYTHYQGYRFCIGVNANGFGDGRGTHVSLGCAQMRGEFDSILPWPAKVTIKLELLNQHQDNPSRKHREVVHWFAWSAPITSGSGGVYAFKNASKFISHEELSLNEDQQTEYLKQNYLKFRVTTLEVIN